MSLCQQQVSFKWTKTPTRMGAHKNFARERHGGLKSMASAEREPITGVWGPSLQLGSGAKVLVKGSGGEALKSESLEAFVRLKDPKLCCQYDKTV